VAERIERAARSKSADGIVRKTLVPSKKVVVRKNGKKLALKKALYPGYVFVLMYLTPVSWRLVLSVPGVVGIVSSGRRPAAVEGEVFR